MSEQSYQEHLAELKQEQKGFSREEIRQHLEDRRDENGEPVYQHVFDPDTAVPQAHIWVDRGALMSCEGAMHPNHRAFKRRANMGTSNT